MKRNTDNLKVLTTISLLLGHYIADSVHPDERPDTTTDRWLTFNDEAVSDTTGVSVCRQRQKSAYILFYKRQVRRQRRHILDSSPEEEGQFETQQQCIYCESLVCIFRCRTGGAETWTHQGLNDRHHPSRGEPAVREEFVEH